MSAELLPFLIPPWQHQLEAIKKAKDLNAYALFFEMGAGKTSTAINILRHVYARHGRLLKTLVVCPPIVIENWRREFLAHSKIAAKDIIPLMGPGKARLKTFQKYDEPKIFITNFESLLMKDLYAALENWVPTVLIVDESHKVKDYKAKRTKSIISLADKASFRYLLSGSPILNTPMDIFTQFRVLDNGDTFGKNFYVFRANYFYDKNSQMPSHKYFPNWTIKPGALEAINEKIQTKSMRVLKKDCLDLPPLVKEERFVPLSPEQVRLYAEMKKDFIAYAEGKASVAQIALTKALRLMQIVSGFITVEEEDGKRSNLVIKDNPRLDALEELLTEIAPHAKCLIWCVFRENYAAIRNVCDKLQLPFVEVHGDIPQKEKLAAVDRFNNDSSCRVFIGHPGSGGIGINLVAANYSIFYSRTFSLEQDIQAEARNHRGGSEIHEKITRIDLVAPGTIDELVTRRLALKQQISDKILLQHFVEDLKNEQL